MPVGHRGQGIYDYVYEAERPELFYKGSAARTVGPHAAVGLRGDSKLTAVEAELAVVVGADGAIVGYTVGNDLSAWDIERENPLFLPQSKIFGGCFAFGPVLATAGEIRDPHALDDPVRHRAGRAPLLPGPGNTARPQAPVRGAGRVALALQRRAARHRALDRHRDPRAGRARAGGRRHREYHDRSRRHAAESGDAPPAVSAPPRREGAFATVPGRCRPG